MANETFNNEMSFYQYLFNEGYYFNKNMVENYLLSLKVNPFVILTGNSGTGKTKLSQLFANYLLSDDNGVFMDTDVKVGSSSSSSGWTMPKDIAYRLLPYVDFDNFTIPIVVDNIPAKAKIKQPIISYSGKELKQHLKDLAEIDENQRVILKIKISENPQSNYKIIPVGANWTDNTPILGFHNVITNENETTPSYDLIKKAQLDSHNPYFLILDEMNLSHVERYFSDFLSAIESGEEIPLNGMDSLKIPNNLLIVGTVNVDETTYMFSPKVLDRANTIEFDTLLAKDYMDFDFNFDDFKGDIKYLQSPLSGAEVSKLNIRQLKGILSKVTYQGENLWDILSKELTNLQKALEGSQFDFGFRVINEILRFMVVAWRYENSPKEWGQWERYFDAQIKQKILPKVHGSEKAIGNVLTNLFNICLVDRNNNEKPKNFNINREDCRYYTSAVKLQKMSKVLSDQRYVSFIN